MKAKDIPLGSKVRLETGKIVTVKEILNSWYRGYCHLVYGKDRAKDFAQVRKSADLKLVNGAYEE